MDINEMKFGDVAALVNALNGRQAEGTIPHPFLGEYVIVRCDGAGVHAGVLEEADGRSCRLSESRRLWYWKCAKGAFLSGVAKHGLDASSKIGEAVDIVLTENCEIILCTKTAEASICSLPDHEGATDV